LTDLDALQCPRVHPDQGVVPFVDLGSSFALVREGLLAEIGELMDSGHFTNGPQVAAFESAFAAYCDAQHCVGTASGLDALRFALLAAGLEPGAEVIVPANTFVATLEAVTQARAVPVPVDVTEADYNLDPAAVEAALTPRTQAMVAVHLYGQMADMRTLGALAEHHGLAVVEDACQAHGADRDGISAGTAGVAAAFSFYPAKNLGAAGDAGALVTDGQTVAQRVRMLREHGQASKHSHRIEGYTSRLDTIQAIVLLHKLPHLAHWNDARRELAAAYVERLEGLGDLRLPPVPQGSNPVWQLFVVRTAHPERFQRFLGEREIGTGRHYPEPAHLTEAYAHLGIPEGSLPVSETLAREVVSLPIFPGMTLEQVDAVGEAISDYFTSG
jgi:dTDP-3-amino-3,4,6-trideoxy-alpha-D-glucose transaminase